MNGWEAVGTFPLQLEYMTCEKQRVIDYSQRSSDPHYFHLSNNP